MASAMFTEQTVHIHVQAEVVAAIKNEVQILSFIAVLFEVNHFLASEDLLVSRNLTFSGNTVNWMHLISYCLSKEIMI